MNDYERIRDILDKSSYTVAMCGTDMMKESGMPSLRAPEIAYQVEKEFGYSPEEIFSSVFYANRPDTFFKYYLGMDAEAPSGAQCRLLRAGGAGKARKAAVQYCE